MSKKQIRKTKKIIRATKKRLVKVNLEYVKKNYNKIKEILSSNRIISIKQKELCKKAEILSGLILMNNPKNLTDKDFKPAYLIFNQIRETDIKTLPKVSQRIQRSRSPIFKMFIALKEDIEKDLNGRYQYKQNIKNMLNEIAARSYHFAEEFLQGKFEDFTDFNELENDLNEVRKQLGIYDEYK
jgi:hypothetical protein